MSASQAEHVPRATDARCPVPNCTQARAQFLEPNFDPQSSAMPRYARFDFCSDRASNSQVHVIPFPVLTLPRQVLPAAVLRETGIEDDLLPSS